MSIRSRIVMTGSPRLSPRYPLGTFGSAALSAGVMFAVASLANAQVLHSNGTFITNPTGGTGSIAGLAISNAEGFTIPGQVSTFTTTGIGATVLATTAVAEDFSVPAGGWDLDSLTVYAFQTSQTSPSITQVRVNLWTAPPFSANSPGVLPDPLPVAVLAAPLQLSAGTGTFVAHRQSLTSTTTVRPVFSYTVPLNGLPNQGQLAEGTYWIEWSFVGATSPSQNVFIPLVTPRGQLPVHNARLFNSITGAAADPRSWFEGREGFVANVADGRAYSLPFELSGTANVCPVCAADYNQDGGVTGDDVAAFFAEFEGGGNCADVNQDGGITGDDVAAFFDAYEAGGCS